MNREGLINSLAEMQEFSVVPASYYERVSVGGAEKNSKRPKNRKPGQRYNAGADPRFSALLAYSAPTDKGFTYFLRYMAFTVAANLAFHNLSVPNGQQMSRMLELSGYTAAQMEEYVQHEVGLEPEAVPSRRLAPTVFLLSRVLCDALSDPTEWRRRKRTVPNPSLERLKALVAYMTETGLLYFFERPDYDGSGKEGGSRDAASYERFVLLHAEDAVKHKAITSELDDAFEQLKRKTKQIKDERDKAYDRGEAQKRRRNGAKSIAPLAAPAGPVPPLPNLRPSDVISETLQDELQSKYADEATRALQTIRGELKGPDAMPPEEMTRLMERYRKSMPPDVQERVGKLNQEIDALTDLFYKVMDQADELRKDLKREQKAEMRDEYIPAVAEGLFQAILTGRDETYKLKVGRYIWQDFMAESNIPIQNVPFAPMEDDDEWDNVCTDINGKLALRIFDEDDIVTLQTDSGRGVESITLPLGSALAKLSDRPTEPSLYIRKSYVKMFKEAGYSDRKARDFAIILATLSSVNVLETGGYDYDYDEMYGLREGDAPSEGSASVETERSAREDAERRLKQAQKENQAARHEIHTLQKEIERLKQQMANQKGEREDTEAEIQGSPPGEPITYPYRTNLRVVVYGGFEVFHKELLKLLPDIRIVASAAHIDAAPVRNADIVFLQTNKTNHSNYWAVRDACKNCGVPYIHLNYASAKRCAEVMVGELRKLEAGRQAPEEGAD
ncbi:MAG: hypothetical protein LUF28_00730 [Clostridiales bacterium]|nr:hypothetical protein [Clostridiales bacterium]